MKKGAVEKQAGAGGAGFFARHPWLPAVILAVYVALLALGTAGEVFHVQWILDLPIFKGP